MPVAKILMLEANAERHEKQVARLISSSLIGKQCYLLSKTARAPSFQIRYSDVKDFIRDVRDFLKGIGRQSSIDPRKCDTCRLFRFCEPSFGARYVISHF